MRYGSVCSGIEAATVAFEPLGWEAAWLAEIEPFPSAVLAHHYPDVPNLGDMTTIAGRVLAGEVEAPDLFCGGTPCQSFSVAGLRKGLEDDRGNLTLQFVKLANAIDHIRSTAGREPAWILWENVPGVLNTHDNSFGAFLGGLCGRDEPIPQPAGGWTSAGVVDGPTRVAAWRTLDAQHFGLAQRRKRVFVLALGGPGRWAAADALLPIIESSRWHPAPSRGKGKGTARGFETGPSGSRITDLAPTIDCRAKNGPIQNQLGVGVMEVIPEVTRPLTAAMGTKWNGNGDLESSLIPSVAHTLRGEGFDASEDGTGRGIPLVTHWPADLASTLDAHFGDKMGLENQHVNSGCPLFVPAEAPMLIRMREGKEGGGKGPLISKDQSLTLATANDQVLIGAIAWDEELNPTIDIAGTLMRGGDGGRHSGVMAFAQNQLGELRTGEVFNTLNTNSNASGRNTPMVQSAMQVRRLTPRECARLQGFPDDYLDITYRGKPAADGNKYKALGNSWATPCAKYIAERIQAVTKPTT